MPRSASAFSKACAKPVCRNEWKKAVLSERTSVLIAIVVPSTVAGAPRLWLAVAAAAIAMVATRNSLIAMTVGTVAAGLARSIGG